MLQLIDRSTGEPVTYGSKLYGHYGASECTFDRVHTLPTRDAVGYAGGMICVRNAGGHRTTTTVASFPHLYWEDEAPTSVPCTVCGAPLSIGEGSTCADSGAPCKVTADCEALALDAERRAELAPTQKERETWLRIAQEWWVSA